MLPFLDISIHPQAVTRWWRRGATPAGARLGAAGCEGVRRTGITDVSNTVSKHAPPLPSSPPSPFLLPPFLCVSVNRDPVAKGQASQAFSGASKASLSLVCGTSFDHPDGMIHNEAFTLHSLAVLKLEVLSSVSPTDPLWYTNLAMPCWAKIRPVTRSRAGKVYMFTFYGSSH